MKGTSGQKHSDACRRRMEHATQDSSKVKRANQRINEYLEKALQKEDEKSKKRKTDHGMEVEAAKADMDEAMAPAGVQEEAASASQGVAPRGCKRFREAADEDDLDLGQVNECDVKEAEIYGKAVNDEILEVVVPILDDNGSDRNFANWDECGEELDHER